MTTSVFSPDLIIAPSTSASDGIGAFVGAVYRAAAFSQLALPLAAVSVQIRGDLHSPSAAPSAASDVFASPTTATARCFAASNA